MWLSSRGKDVLRNTSTVRVHTIIDRGRSAYYLSHRWNRSNRRVYSGLYVLRKSLWERYIV